MEKDWVIEEFLNLELGDQRLEERSRRLMRQLSGNPTDSIPTACASWSDLKAAYRLFANVNLTGRFTYYSYGFGNDLAPIDDVKSLIFGTNLSF